VCSIDCARRVIGCTIRLPWEASSGGLIRSIRRSLAGEGVDLVSGLLEALTARQSDEMNAYSGMLRCPELLQNPRRFIWAIPGFNDEAQLSSLGSRMYADREDPDPTMFAFLNGFSQNKILRSEKLVPS